MATAFTTRQIPTFSAVRHQPVAPKSAAAGRRHIRHVAILVAIGVVFMLAFVWIRIRVIQLGYEVSRIRKETSELKQQKSRLEAEVESLKSPSRIEAIARDRFMMRLPMSDAAGDGRGRSGDDGGAGCHADESHADVSSGDAWGSGAQASMTWSTTSAATTLRRPARSAFSTGTMTVMSLWRIWMVRYSRC